MEYVRTRHPTRVVQLVQLFVSVSCVAADVRFESLNHGYRAVPPSEPLSLKPRVFCPTFDEFDSNLHGHQQYVPSAACVAAPVVVHAVDGGVCTQQPHPPLVHSDELHVLVNS